MPKDKEKPKLNGIEPKMIIIDDPMTETFDDHGEDPYHSGDPDSFTNEMDLLDEPHPFSDIEDEDDWPDGGYGEDGLHNPFGDGEAEYF